MDLTVPGYVSRPKSHAPCHLKIREKREQFKRIHVIFQPSIYTSFFKDPCHLPTIKEYTGIVNPIGSMYGMLTLDLP